MIPSGVVQRDERKRTADERSKQNRRCQNGGVSHSGTSLGGVLKPGPDGIRLKGGVNLNQALAWNGRTCRPDAKGKGRVGSPCETRVPMRDTGAEQPVVGLKAS